MAGGEDPLFLHASSHSPFFGSRSMVNFVLEDDMEEYLNYQPEKKRRLGVEQVKFLEKCFEMENKLEPERKIQLARDLGMQPRQVAIWFQNRRARWKTKQLERDFAAMKAGFDCLKADYENLVKDNDKLKVQISVLTDKLLEKEKRKTSCSENSNPNLKPDDPQNPPAESLSEHEISKPAIKYEEMDSTKSVNFDSDKNYNEGMQFKAGRDSIRYAFEREQSDMCQEKNGEFSKTLFANCVFAKLEDVSCSDPLVGSCNFSDDTAFWSWSY